LRGTRTALRKKNLIDPKTLKDKLTAKQQKGQKRQTRLAKKKPVPGQPAAEVKELAKTPARKKVAHDEPNKLNRIRKEEEEGR
jgi:hypothetical protein